MQANRESTPEFTDEVDEFGENDIDIDRVTQMDSVRMVLHSLTACEAYYTFTNYSLHVPSYMSVVFNFVSYTILNI